VCKLLKFWFDLLTTCAVASFQTPAASRTGLYIASLSLSLIACPKPSTRCIAIILTPFFNQSVNILENIYGKQDVTQILQFPVFIQTDLKRTESAIGSGLLSGCWPSIAAVPWRIKLLLEVFM
jgi:hypothetical protein